MNNILQWSQNISRMNADLSWIKSVFTIKPGEVLNTSDAYHPIIIADSGRVFTRQFFDTIQCLGNLSSTDCIFLVAHKPDPISIYWDRFGIIPFVEISLSTTARSYLDVLHFKPFDEADSIATLAEEFVFFDDSRRWVLLVERNGELVRLFVKDDIDDELYSTSFPKEWCFDVIDVQDHLLRFHLSESEIDRISMAVSK